MITEDYVSYEVAKLLKNKGFDGNVSAYYHIWDNGSHIYTALEFSHSEAPHLYIPAPTLQMACKWLREEFDLNIEIDTIGCKDRGTLSWRSTIFNLNNQCECYYNETCSTYKEAAEIALKHALENLI